MSDSAGTPVELDERLARRERLRRSVQVRVLGRLYLCAGFAGILASAGGAILERLLGSRAAEAFQGTEFEELHREGVERRPEWWGELVPFIERLVLTERLLLCLSIATVVSAAALTRGRAWARTALEAVTWASLACGLAFDAMWGNVTSIVRRLIQYPVWDPGEVPPPAGPDWRLRPVWAAVHLGLIWWLRRRAVRDALR